MTAHFTNAHIFCIAFIATLSVIALLVAINCLLDAHRILVWYEKQYFSMPRVNTPPRRRWWHKAFLSLLIIPKTFH